MLIGFLLLPVGARGLEVEVPRIAAIRFHGNREVSDSALRGAMRLRQPVWWNPVRDTRYLGPDYLTIDLYRAVDLYRDRGFPFAGIDSVRVRIIDERRVEIDVGLLEGPRVRVERVTLEGVHGPIARRVTRQLRIRRGSWLEEKGIRRSRDAIEAVYAEAGFLAAQVHTDFSIDGDRANLFFRVQEGPFYALRAAWVDTLASPDRRTDRTIIDREVALKPGETLRASKILKTQERIYETGAFRSVRVLPVPDSTGLPQADLQIVVHERKRGWYGFGAGYSSDDRVRLLAEWGNRNLSWKARRIEVTADLSYAIDPVGRSRGVPLRSALGRIRYIEPWFLATRTKSITSVSHTFDRPGSFDQDITEIDQQFRRPIGRLSIGGLGITNKWVRTGDPDAATNTYTTRHFSALLEEDRRDHPLDARRGTHARLQVEFAGGLLGGRSEFHRWIGSASWYRALSPRLVLASRLRLGLTVPIGSVAAEGRDSLKAAQIPYEERFFLGGGTSVRGYQENGLGRRRESGEAIGGTVLALGSVEMRFPIVWLLGGVAFLDAGNVWDDPSEIKPVRFRRGLETGAWNPLDVRYGAGVGLRFLTPVGPIRLDYGLKVGSGSAAGERRGEVHLSLGQAF